jgi:imidazole glycerol-phosphate synthase subunit HisH
MKVGVIDYGVGNLGSVLRSLEELRVAPTLVNRAINLHAMDCLILPGVGNFADCARLLSEGGWPEALRQEVLGGGKPLLGVCVGMQLLASGSAEGANIANPDGIKGLSFIPGRVEHLRTLCCNQRVPHVGWNGVTSTHSQSGLFDGIANGTDFYFVHSYAFVPADKADILATTDYGVQVTAAVGRGKVWGTQFHPEKSSRAGFRLLRNFIEGRAC